MSRRHPSILATVAGAVLALAAGAVPLHAAIALDCPASTVDMPGVHRESVAVSDDTLFTVAGTDDSYGGWFDLRVDSLRAYASVSSYGDPAAPPGATTVMRESYRLVGPAPGTPVPFELVMPMSAYVTEYPGVPQGYGALAFDLSVDGVVVAAFPRQEYCCHVTTSATLTAPLTRTVGTWFEVAPRVIASACRRGSCAMGAGLHFAGLPVGVGVVSCHGDTVVSTTAVSTAPPRPALRLERVWPNPARGAVRIAFTVPHAGPVSLQVIDLAGRVVGSWRWESATAGTRTVVWGEDGSLPAGSYFVRVTQGAVSDTRRVSLLR